MTRKLGLALFIVALALPAIAEAGPNAISGYVRNSSGIPQIGAGVEILATSTVPIVTVFTDTNGFFFTPELKSGTYSVKVVAPSFLPALRENVTVRSGASMAVNITLNTLFEAIQLLPARKQANDDEDDWKWTLRSMSNRPILRVLDNGPLVVVSESEKSDDRVLKARVAFLAGSDAEGFGGSADMRTAFSFEKSLFSTGTLSLNGNVAYGATAFPATAVRATYSHRLPDGSTPELAFTVRRFAAPEMAPHSAALQALALSLSDKIAVANFIDLNFGSELQTVQFGGRVTGFRPFGSAAVHLSPNTVVEYLFATSEPNMRTAKGFDSAPADLSESGPRVSLSDSKLVLERARHHEVSVSQRVGKTNFQLAAYSDRIIDPALTGVGEVTAESGDYLPDVYSGTFSYRGRKLNTNGFRAVVERKLTDDLTATLNYSFGGVLDLENPGVGIENVRANMGVRKRQSVSYKMTGNLPFSKTRWIASYKWTNGSALTPVDLFNASPGQADPYLNVFVRQPIPTMGFLPAHMEALIDVRNLLAQGYLPVMGVDGHTLYLVQSARAVRGGFSFTF